MSSLDDLRRRINELDRKSSSWSANARRPAGRLHVPSAHRACDARLQPRARGAAGGTRGGKQYGVSPQVAENILRLLIRSSLTTQEQASVAAQGAGSGTYGAGHRWRRQDGPLVREFMASQGFAVEIADPAGAPPGFTHLPDWRASALTTTSSSSPRRSARPTRSFASWPCVRPKGVIFDVGSLKSPLRAGLNALKSHGCRVTSLHRCSGPAPNCFSAGT
jgi:chorismate mutase/prephenate dehydrogenase